MSKLKNFTIVNAPVQTAQFIKQVASLGYTRVDAIKASGLLGVDSLGREINGIKFIVGYRDKINTGHGRKTKVRQYKIFEAVGTIDKKLERLVSYHFSVGNEWRDIKGWAGDVLSRIRKYDPKITIEEVDRLVQIYLDGPYIKFDQNSMECFASKPEHLVDASS
tara:strand:- start:74 stop:565 length:492 start_codon:yes stop_codon:yes gene_type:complete